jgi:hypothetical protein
MRPSDILVGRAVTEVAALEHGLLIRFNGDFKLLVINPFLVSGRDTAADLVGDKLVGFVGEGTFERLTFSSGAALTVDLRDDSWSGPEAMTLSGPDLTVVWN